MRVLLADDDATARVLLEDILSSLGYEVLVACDGQEALDILGSEQPPALAVLDWIMPRLEGPEVCRAIKGRDEGPFIYTLILTGRNEQGIISRGLDAGADDFLSKPVDVDELRSRLAVGVRMIEYDRVLRQKNEELNAYATRMETLAQERARQLVHNERLAMLGTLSAGLAHELANPIAAASNNLTLAQENWNDVAPALAELANQDRPDIKFIKMAVETMPAVLQGMEQSLAHTMKLASGLKGHARKGQEERSACDMNVSIERALGLCQHKLKYNINVERALDPALPQILANCQQIEQVLVNLFVNAADAMEDQGGGTLRIATGREDGRVVVHVQDTGPGIPAGKLETIWEPFFTTKAPDKGTGLGLSIIQGIIADHEGTISVQNEPAGGAQFVIALPYTTTEPAGGSTCAS